MEGTAKKLPILRFAMSKEFFSRKKFLQKGNENKLSEAAVCCSRFSACDTKHFAYVKLACTTLSFACFDSKVINGTRGVS